MSKSSANGLSVVHKNSGGLATSDVPDVCFTKIGKKNVEVAYVNLAESKDLDKGTSTVSMNGTSIGLANSVFSKSTGDEAGDKKGVASGTIKGEAAFTTSSDSVTIEGQGVARHTDMMTMNDANTVCAAGVMQDSFNVESDEEGTYTLDLHIRYPDGTGLSYAPFKLVDEGGGELASGQLDAAGYAEINNLPNITCFVECSESSIPFEVTHVLDINEQYQPSPDIEQLLDKSRGKDTPFWQFDNKAQGQPWGTFSTSLYESKEFSVMLRNVIEINWPYSESNQTIDAIKSTILNIIEHDEVKPEYSNDLISLIAPLAHKEGVLSRLLTTIEPEKTYCELCAHARYVGKGDPQQYFDAYTTDCARSDADRYSSSTIGIFDVLIDQLNYCKRQAEEKELTLVKADITAHIERLSLKRSEVSEAIQSTLLAATKRLSELKEQSEKVEVTMSEPFGFETASASIAVANVTVNSVQLPHYLPEHRYNASTFTFSG